MTDQKKPRPRYAYIEAWHRLTGSYDYYIRDLQDRAATERAPDDAIYYSIDDKCWRRVADLAPEHDMRTRMETYLNDKYAAP